MDVAKFHWILVTGGAALVAHTHCSPAADEPAGEDDGGGTATGGGATSATSATSTASAATGTGGTGGAGGAEATSSTDGGGDAGEGGQTPEPVCSDECAGQEHGPDGACVGFPCCWAAPACCEVCCS